MSATLPPEILRIPCLADNYAWALHDAATGRTAVIDVPEAAPVLAAVRARGWQISDILITHHHDDHIAGVGALREATGARVTGARADAHRLPALDLACAPGDRLDLGQLQIEVLDAPGHTLGHIAFYCAGAGAAFTADSLMVLGCGRLFEGSAQQMFDTLTRLAALPGETLICSGHEYAASNARFALTIDPANPNLIARADAITAARAAGQPTVPVTLATELATNPYLRCSDPAIRAGLGLEDASDAAVFAEIRTRKDRF